ncbi:MAG: UDP-N-acetylmuramate dehydrogenase [Minisyncoccia bacterium]
MKIRENTALKQYTSMCVGGPALYFTSVSSKEELIEAIKFTKDRKLPHFILGGGSNILVSDKGFPGLVIKMSILGKELLNDNIEYVEYELGAGENWDKFVEFTVKNSLFGIENMSHIPGTVGASVVQNIGCYGQEVAPTVKEIKVLELDTLNTLVLQNSDLKFSYRKSILNSERKGKYIVTSVVFRLEKQGKLSLNYDDLRKYFENNANIEPNLKTVREVVIKIRDSKFPYPDSPKNGSVGSFWNAEAVDEKTYEGIIEKLRRRGYEDKALEMENKKSAFTVAQGYKVPYGVLIEVLGFKGKKYGGAKILKTHAGIINNYSGEATAKEIYELSNKVIERIEKEFGIRLKLEPELVGDFN